MDDSNETTGMKFRLGLMIIFGFVILVTLIVIFSDWQSIFAGNRYKVNVLFQNAPGVKENTPIKQSGILIGRVRKVELVEQGAMVTAFIETQYKLYDNQAFRLTLNILGDAELNILQQTPRTADTKQVKPGEVLQGYMAPSMLQMATDMQNNIVAAIDSITDTSQKLNRILTNLDDVFMENKDDMKGMVSQLRDLAQQTRELIAKTNEMLSDPEVQAGIHDSIVALPQTISDAKEVFAEFKTTAHKVNNLADSFGTIIQNSGETLDVINQVAKKTDQSLGDLNNITGTLSDRKGIWMEKISRSLDNLDNALLQISEFTTTLNSTDGTIGRLANDPTLYEKIESTIDEIRELKRQLEPVVANAQVFSDKIARHPEQLGVAGALQRNNGGAKGVPPIPSDLQNEFQRFRSEGGGYSTGSNGVIYGPTYQQPSTQWQPASAY
ncbi:MAG: MCE family protein [Thermoguttaceae bacterium]|nr:MCE family protein [Thermoguttaceae bacterium]